VRLRVSKLIAKVSVRRNAFNSQERNNANVKRVYVCNERERPMTAHNKTIIPQKPGKSEGHLWWCRRVLNRTAPQALTWRQCWTKCRAATNENNVTRLNFPPE